MNKADFINVIQAVKMLADFNRPWAVCGGWAIDLYLNRLTRLHKDVDFVILRRDQLVIQEYLLSREWTLEKAVRGQLTPWPTGVWLDPPTHVIWCKKLNASPDFIELLLDEVDSVNFLFRRDPSITLPIEKSIITAGFGIPILAPEIVLLYKSANAQDPSVAIDFKNVLPKLSSERRIWLVAALRKLNTDHVWLEDLS